MRKNIKHYYLYFFALIFSVILYFVFSTLQYDTSVVEKTGKSLSMGTAFKVAGILLIFIAGIFVTYANAIFLKRRSREIGLYQLIGLTRGTVSRLLIVENLLLSIGALLIGIASGMLVSRLFLLILMKLIGFEGFIQVSFSTAAVIQTVVVFMAIILLTSLQMVFTVYRNTLLNLFNAEKKDEYPKKPKAFISAVLAILGIGLIVFGYWLSGRMMNAMLFFNALTVLGSTILGTYLLFRVTISWVLYKIRSGKNGHLGLTNSLSLAPLMHRMKSNANSLTIIAVLSAMTLAMSASAYSLYYSTEKESRFLMPYDFMFAEPHISTEVPEQFLQMLEENDIAYTKSFIEMFEVDGMFEADDFPEFLPEMAGVDIISNKQLEDVGVEVDISDSKNGVIHDTAIYWLLKNMKLPFNVKLSNPNINDDIVIEKVGQGNVLNFTRESMNVQLVVTEARYNELKAQFAKNNEEFSMSQVMAINLVEQDDHEEASALFNEFVGKHEAPEVRQLLGLHYYSMYSDSMQANGILIFIAGFLGLVFLISTGSILYFKQMTEAEQEKQGYLTLRQLGFTTEDIMKGIIRKQIFVYGLPLLVGMLHSIFAIKAASFIFTSDITIPTVIAMAVYVLIYLVFAVLTVGYYRKIIKNVLI